MKSIFCLTLLTFTLAAALSAQSTKTVVSPGSAGNAASAANTPAERAKAALAAHGGEKLKGMRSFVVRGSVDVTTSAFNQAIPSTFEIVIAGDKYFFEINNPIQPLKQIFNGRQTYSSVQGFSLPPITSLGFPLLQRIGDAGYVIASLPEDKKKRAGFRITTPEGYYTDFLIDEKTGQVKGYESSYEYNGKTITTSVVIDKCLTVEGVLVPEKYSQRFDLGALTAYADFKAKTILVNSTITDDVFAMPK
jgi:hypothetical protein